MGGRRRTSPPSLFTVSPHIHARFKSAMNMCSDPDSVAGLSAWGSFNCLKCWHICQAMWVVCWRGLWVLGTRRWEGSSTPIYLVSLCSSCAPAPHTHTASPLPGSGLACVAHCFQNEITLSHGENKSPRLYRQVSLKVFEEDLQGSSLMDDIGGKYEHQCLSIF